MGQWIQSPLNKLSISFLADAITRIEITESTPFAVIGTKEAIATLRNFISALNISNSSGGIPGHLWGITLVEFDKLDSGCLVFACKLKGGNNPVDYTNALEHLVTWDLNEKGIYGEKLIDENVWGLKVCLR